MTTRIEIINAALIATGNAPCAVEFDGSDEWTVAYSAYQRAVEWLLALHNWGFATKQVTLVQVAAPTTPRTYYAYGFALPGDMLTLREVWYGGTPLTDYNIVDGVLNCPYTDPAIEAVYVREPTQSVWPTLFVEPLTLKCEAACARALNEDAVSAREREQAAEDAFALGRTKNDQQQGNGGRSFYRSRIITRRQTGGRPI